MSRMYTLATLMVCCSMASWMLALSCSRILLNSSSGGWGVCIKMFYLVKIDIPSTYATEASICQHQSSCLQLPFTTVLRKKLVKSFVTALAGIRIICSGLFTWKMIIYWLLFFPVYEQQAFTECSECNSAANFILKLLGGARVVVPGGSATSSWH